MLRVTTNKMKTFFTRHHATRAIAKIDAKISEYREQLDYIAKTRNAVYKWTYGRLYCMDCGTYTMLWRKELAIYNAIARLNKIRENIIYKYL